MEPRGWTEARGVGPLGAALFIGGPALVVGALTLTLSDARPDDPSVLLLEVSYEAPKDVASIDFAAAPALPDQAVVPAPDAILASPMLDHPEFLTEVQRWVHFFETRSSRWFPGYLERMTWFEDHVDEVLEARGLPWSLRYLPVLESGYSPTAVSSARAVGLWQFMAPTARDFGMRIDRTLDERRDPFKSTDAAARFLEQLHGEFDSWFLALAGYNGGPQRVRNLIRRYASPGPTSDRTYWEIRPYLPRETQDFVPKFVAAMVIASNPEAHGYRTPAKRPFEFERVRVAPGTRLSTVARVAGVARAEIERLNPEYVQGRTPSSGSSYVRVPVGRAAGWDARLRSRSGDGADF